MGKHWLVWKHYLIVEMAIGKYLVDFFPSKLAT